MTNIFYPPSQNAIQKTLDAQLLSGITASMTLNNVTGIQNKAGVCVVDLIDANEKFTPAKREYISFTGVSGNTLTGLTRNADGGGSDQDHAVGAIVQFPADSLQQQALIDNFLEQHADGGVHTDALVTTLKATGAVVNTGTSDVTIVTPKALADSDYAKTSDITVTADSTTTFTNKTLTSPKINEDVALTATATQLNALVGASSADGWISAAETWTYASASTITVPSGAAAKYAKGDKIRWKQGAGYKYAYVVTVADTLLTVTGGTDFTVETPTAITDNYYSHQESPIGFPQYFNSTVTFDVATLDNGSGGQPTINYARFSINGNTCLGYMSITGTKAATTKTMVITSSGLPTPVTLANANSGSANYDNGSNYVPIGIIYRSSGVFWFVSASDITDNSTVANLSSQFKYQI